MFSYLGRTTTNFITISLIFSNNMCVFNQYVPNISIFTYYAKINPVFSFKNVANSTHFGWGKNSEASLPVSKGSFGLRSAEALSSGAYLTSHLLAQPRVQRMRHVGRAKETVVEEPIFNEEQLLEGGLGRLQAPRCLS